MATREEALSLILDTLNPEDLVIACNGKLGRELFELRVQREEPNNDFIMVGAMGCALALAIAVARKTDKKVVCLLGDGNFIMGLPSLATFLEHETRNLHVFIINNDAHDSTGGQPTAFHALRTILPHRYNFRVIDVAKGARPDLGRPTLSPAEITKKFMQKCLTQNG
jgi:thiamine pyrophosphate-dependent acetolactate synthase large subunit-like protein